jgi:hypothetical protein
LTLAERGLHVVLNVFVLVVHRDFDELSGQVFSKLGDIALAKQKDVLVLELAVGLLGHLLSFEFLPIDELARGVDGLEFRLGLEGDIFHRMQVDLHGVQLFAEVGRKQRHIRLNVDLQKVNFLRF